MLTVEWYCSSTRCTRFQGLVRQRFLRKYIREQDEALTAVANSMRDQRAGHFGDNCSIASFPILGPTRVGKIESSKKLASSLFLHESNLNRFDMSDFQEKHMVTCRLCWL